MSTTVVTNLQDRRAEVSTRSGKITVTNLQDRRADLAARSGRVATVYAQAAPGPMGPPGTASAGAFFHFINGVPSTIWTINHNLGFYPAVTTIENTGDIMEGELEYVDINNVIVHFAYAVDGDAYLS